MFKGQPKGLFALALANTGERFGYYTMIAVFALFLRANFGLDPGTAGLIYSTFLMLVYFLPLIGGILADKFGFGKMVTTGIIIMFFGYLLLSVPLGSGTMALVGMIAALLLIGFGTGLFKGNLQVMVGDLYNEPQYADKRDAGFSLFYMAINIGALFAPTAAVKIREWAISLGFDGNAAYHFSFAVACVSLIVSIAIYYLFRSWFKHVLQQYYAQIEQGRSRAEIAQVYEVFFALGGEDYVAVMQVAVNCGVAVGQGVDEAFDSLPFLIGQEGVQVHLLFILLLYVGEETFWGYGLVELLAHVGKLLGVLLQVFGVFRYGSGVGFLAQHALE